MLAELPYGRSSLSSSHTSVTNEGTTLTAHATPHTKVTAFTQIIASTAFDAYGITVQISGVGVASTNTRFLVDIGIGGSGSEIVLLPDLNAGNAPIWAGTPAGGVYYHFPIAIPAGSRLSGRAQALVTVDVCTVMIWLHGYPTGPSGWYGSRVTAYGLDAANTRGTSITPGSTSSYGSAAQIASSTANKIRYMQIGMDMLASTTGTSMRGLLRLGVGATPDYFVEHLPIGESTTYENMEFRQTNFMLSKMLFNFPAATDLRASAMVNGTGVARGLIIYGVD